MSGLEAVLAAHEPAEDWHCACGEDMFGGTAAYSIAAHRAHVADQIRAHLAEARAARALREQGRLGVAVVYEIQGEQ